ncbi:Smr/MutS family protein [Geothrix sp. PMB-07]|uniref:Smr/MutS family protein n=1 Tax=Geothrix sp. PMB-07 TaxID=3068640 RepID=UPI002741D0C6|nr:Smr/MutS family protein [Geothrix sp. PMB-07]WLT32660.1 Smr/MutS family protein [Geothrix sp. PMB-07]
MGATLPEPSAPATEAATPKEPPVPETFQAALKDLKGIKPLQKGGMDFDTPAPKATVPAPKLEPPQLDTSRELVAEAPRASEASPKEITPAERAPAPNTPPVRFQLAAGMAIEVDGSLDLRGHSLVDALDRLKDRLGDGTVLGWRSLQVNLGTDPALHEGLLALLASGEVPMVARYAQAPVPMGGTQAWLLYFGSSPTQPAPRRES